MRKRGPKPKKIINTKWSANLAYAVGLIATDGCLSGDGLLVDLTSNDREQLNNYCECLEVNFKICDKSSGGGRRSLRVQFKNRFFYDYLLSIGLTPAKSKTIKKIAVPDKYFFDFLRGCFDGDGCFYSYWDPRWKSSFMFYTEFCSASPIFIKWLQQKINILASINGHVTTAGKTHSMQQLKYAKQESIILLKKMYYSPKNIFLSRKRLKINKALGIVGMKI
ncbi:MAG: hypothetical protein WC657_03190 [Candidatus Paceibacterota bacterium]|jgi:hypothetical protein